MKHTCHVPGCDVAVRRKMLMCRRHWRMVPSDLQVAVKGTFNPRQCQPGTNCRPSQAWLRAARWAINAVVEQERKEGAA